MSKTHPSIQEIDMPIKDTEYEVVIPKDVKSYTVKTRGNHEFKLAYKSEQVNSAIGEFITIPAGSGESEDDLNRVDPFTLYVSCEVDSEKLEVKIWK